MASIPETIVRTIRRALAPLAIVAATLAPGWAAAAGCPGKPGALGTSRTLAIDAREFPRLGTMQYAHTLPLDDKEVVLTFDDGPLPPYSNRVLDILAEHCVKAHYFVIGRMARGYPDIVRRMLAEGHVVGTHSENHLLAFDRMPLHAVQREVETGFASVRAALGRRDAVAPFFRIPGLLRAPQVEGYLEKAGLVTWSADLTGDDWKHVSAREVVRRVMDRLAEKGKGIVLLHDIQPATALALPELLRELKAGGYRIVQVVPGRPRGPLNATATEPAADAPPAVQTTAIQTVTSKSDPAETSAADQPTTTPASPAAMQAMARTQVPAAAAQTPVPTPVRRQFGPDHAVDTVASADPPPVTIVPPHRDKPLPPATGRPAPTAEAPDTAPPRTPVVMPRPLEPRASDPSVSERRQSESRPAHTPPAGNASLDRRPVLRPSARDETARVSRPLSPSLKPVRSATTPGKITVLRLEAPPNIVSVPVPGAGGVGVSALVRTSQRPDERFQIGH